MKMSSFPASIFEDAIKMDKSGDGTVDLLDFDAMSDFMTDKGMRELAAFLTAKVERRAAERREIQRLTS